MCLEIMSFAASGPSDSIQTGRPLRAAAFAKAVSVGANTVNVFVPLKKEKKILYDQKLQNSLKNNKIKS